MSSHTINTYVAAGYTVAPGVDHLTIVSPGMIRGYGLRMDHYVNVDNQSVIDATDAGVGNNGVSASAGAQILNAGAISGYNGIEALNLPATIVTYGRITGKARFGTGVFLEAGGTVNNVVIANLKGAQIGTISGQAGGVLSTATATVGNTGLIESQYGPGVSLAGGVVDNGRDGVIQTTQGGIGVEIQRGAGTVVNDGRIEAYAAAGVVFDHTSGPQADSVTNTVTGYIQGTRDGVHFGNSGSVTNFGRIQGGSGDGVYGAGKCTVTNAAGAVIEGGVGVSLHAGVISNSGSILAEGLGTGVFIQGGVVTNGSASNSKALIQGYQGVVVGAYGLNATVINFGTIAGGGARAAVTFSNASDLLVVEAGCAFTGAVQGAGGTLDLDNGTGVLTGAMASGSVTVSGSMAATTFSAFGTVEIGVSASFSTSGAVSLGAGQTIIGAGFLTLGDKADKVANGGVIEALGGTVTVAGKVSGAGSAVIEGGLMDFASTFKEDVAFVGGSGELELAKSRKYKGTISGFSATGGTSLDLGDIAFVGSGEASFSGTKSGGTLTVSDGSHTATIALAGNYLSATFTASSDGAGGTSVKASGGAPALTPPLAFVAAMAGFGRPPAGLERAEAWRTRAAPALVAPRAAFA